MGETVFYDEDTVFCPYCKDDVFDGDSQDGDIKTVTCARCGGEFEYEIEVQYSYHIIGLKPGKKPKLNNPVKKKIVLENYEGKHIEEVDAEELVIPGFEEIKLFLHIINWTWVVSEESTGMCVCSGDSREDVKEKAERVLKHIGKEEAIKVIARQPKISESAQAV